MANLRVATGSILGAVTATATTATSLISNVADGAQMLNAFVKNAQIDQQKRLVIHRKEYDQRLAEEAAMTSLRRTKEINEFLGNDANLTAAYNQSYQEFLSLLENPKA